jgi:hypothetical protein
MQLAVLTCCPTSTTNCSVVAIQSTASHCAQNTCAAASRPNRKWASPHGCDRPDATMASQHVCGRDAHTSKCDSLGFPAQTCQEASAAYNKPTVALAACAWCTRPSAARCTAITTSVTRRMQADKPPATRHPRGPMCAGHVAHMPLGRGKYPAAQRPPANQKRDGQHNQRSTHYA